MAPPKHLFQKEKILFSWIHNLNIQPFAWLMHLCQMLELIQEQLYTYGSLIIIFFFFFLKCRWLWDLYSFSRRYCVHGWFVLSNFCLLLSSWLHSCKGVCWIPSAVHCLFGMGLERQVSFTNPFTGLEPFVSRMSLFILHLITFHFPSKITIIILTINHAVA